MYIFCRFVEVLAIRWPKMMMFSITGSQIFFVNFIFYTKTNEKPNFHTFGGGTSIVMALANRRTDRLVCLEQFFILDRYGIFYKKQHVSGPCSFEEEVVHADTDADATEQCHNVSRLTSQLT